LPRASHASARGKPVVVLIDRAGDSNDIEQRTYRLQQRFFEAETAVLKFKDGGLGNPSSSCVLAAEAPTSTISSGFSSSTPAGAYLRDKRLKN